MKKALYIITLITLTSCSNTMQAVEQGAKQDSRKIRGQIANELYPEGALLTPAVTTHGYSYCYKSWADVSCYKEPVTGQDNLLVGGK